MIDTIVCNFLTTECLPGEDWKTMTTTMPTPHGTYTHNRFFASASTVRLTVQKNQDGRVRMRIEASLPKVLLGHNITALSTVQIRDACTMLHAEVQRLSPDISVPPIESWGVSEVHWCYIWQGTSPSAIINALSETVPPSKAHRITREDDGHGGLTLRRQPRSGRGEWSEQIYDKGAETASLLQAGKIDLARLGLSSEKVMALAQGTLRFEVATRRKALHGILGTPATIDVLWDYLDTQGNTFIRQRWDTVTKNWRPLAVSQVAQKLREQYTLSTANNLFDFWYAVTGLGTLQYKRITGIDADKWRRQVGRLRDVGVAFGAQPDLDCPKIRQ